MAGEMRKLKEFVAKHSELVKVTSQKPWTYVEVVLHCGMRYEGAGFSKVTWPDRWDEQYGIDLARRKAEARIARSMLAGADGSLDAWLHDVTV